MRWTASSWGILWGKKRWRQYLRIIFLGLMFTFLYNFFSSTLRALGDSASPLYFLIISAVLKLLW
ncbi:MATE family efflux transporter [Eubacterium ramulus]